jgi:hypothetical protein
VLVHTSAMEGGAHVSWKRCAAARRCWRAACRATSACWAPTTQATFPHGDAGAWPAAAACRAGQRAEDPASYLLGRLAAQCALRAPLFDAAAERSALLNLLHELDTAP